MTPPALTPSQQAAVIHLEGDAAILAGAGSGKTTVLVEKAAVLIEKLHTPPSRLLIVTFTDKAAAEMKERLAKRLKKRPEDLDALSVGTIHGVAASLLRRFAASLEIPPDFKIMNEFLAGLERLRAVRTTFLDLVEARHAEALEAVQRLGLKGSLRFFGRLLGKVAEGPALPYASVVERISEAYRARKAALGMLDFDDLETRLLDLLGREADALVSLYDWIIVDEFQDTSPLQWRILSHIHRPEKNRLVIVGDPRQSIYRFRRADPGLFREVSQDILKRGGRLFPLNENFRSAPEIIEFVNLVSEPLFDEDFPPLVATRKDLTGAVERLSIPQERYARDTRTAEARSVLEHLLRLRDQGHLWKSMTLLFRTRQAVPFYEEQLKAKKIPYRTSMGESLLERPEIIAATFFLKKLAGPADGEKPLIETALAHSPLSGLEMEATAPLTGFLDALFETVVPRFPPETHRNLGAFKSLLLDLISLDIGTMKGLVENLAALREEEARIPCPAAEESGTDALTLMTVHASKGLEFPVVVLCDLAARQGSSAKTRTPFVETAHGRVVLKEKDPEAAGLKDRLVKSEDYAEVERREKEADHEESKRLLYVALTRAKERLVLPLPLEKKDRKDQTGSEWSDWLAPQPK